MQTRFEFRGTGGELFKGLLKGWLLTAITLGIYLPWFLVGLLKLVTSKMKVRIGDRELDVTYGASGGALFQRGLVGYLLSVITLGIYVPWFMVDLMKFHQEHLSAVQSDGRSFRLRSSLTGGELFKTFLVNYLLTVVTLGIYAPWMICNLQRVVLGATTICEKDQVVGTIAYRGQGGELFQTFLVGYLLTVITLGIYGFWFQVKLLAYFQRGTEITVDGVTYAGNYDATGGESFKINFVGYLLTMLSFGIYLFWYLADLLRFQLAHTSFAPKGAAASAPPLPSSGPRPARTITPAGAGLLPFGLAPDPADPRAAWARAYRIDAGAQATPRAELPPVPSSTPAPTPAPRDPPMPVPSSTPMPTPSPRAASAAALRAEAPAPEPRAAPPAEPPLASAASVLPALPAATPAALSAASLVIEEATADTLPPTGDDAHDTKMNLEPPTFPEAEPDPDVTETLGRNGRASDYLTEILPPRNPVGPAN